MGNRSILLLVLAFYCMEGIAAPAGPALEGSQGIRSRPAIRVCNLAQVDEAILQQAKQMAERVFLNSGIELRWMDCLGRGNDASADGRPPAAREMVLRIIRQTKQGIDATGQFVAGQAIRPAAEVSGGMITIFYERTEMVAEQLRYQYPELKVDAARGIVMGHLMAHEIGHLLLPTPAHAAAGIMKAQLDSRDWGQAVRGVLRFTDKESDLIRQELQITAPTTKGLLPGAGKRLE
jgi:hypothetical protein